MFIHSTLGVKVKRNEEGKQEVITIGLQECMPYLFFSFLFGSFCANRTNSRDAGFKDLKSDRIPHRNGTKVYSSPSLVNGSRSIISSFTSLLTANPVSLATWCALIQSPEDCNIWLLSPLPLILGIRVINPFSLFLRYLLATPRVKLRSLQFERTKYSYIHAP